MILPISTPFDSLLSEKQKNILWYCYLKGRNIEEIASKIKMKVSSYLRKDIIGELVRKNLLKETIVSKAAVYSVNKDLVNIKIILINF